jgi:N-acetylglucosamine-6-phosphate deacetylase
MSATTGARVAGFADRGAIAVGKRADLILFGDAPKATPTPDDEEAATPPTVIAGGERKER